LFRKSPYLFWLLAGLLLWSVAALRFHNRSRALQPPGLAGTLSRNLATRDQWARELLADSATLRQILSGQPTDETLKRLTKSPCLIYLFDSSGLKFWNDNHVLPEPASIHDTRGRLYRLRNDHYIRKDLQFPEGNLVLLYPLKRQFPFENQYLRSGFAASRDIPVSTAILPQPEAGALPVLSPEGKPWLYLRFQPADLPVWTPDATMGWLLAGALFFSLLWLQLIAISLSRKGSRLQGLLLSAGIIIGLRALTYRFGLPFNLESLPAFSPQIYGSSGFLPSLPDLVINLLILLWLSTFALTVLVRARRQSPQLRLHSVWRWLAACGLALLTLVYTGYISSVMRSMVIDSRISFDISHYSSLNGYTLAGMLIMALLIVSSALWLYLLYSLLRILLPGRLYRYSLLAGAGILLIVLVYGAGAAPMPWLTLLWLLLIMLLLDVREFRPAPDVFAPHMILWFALLSLSATVFLLHFTRQKERETRKLFATRVQRQRDPVTHYMMERVARDIRQDSRLRQFLLQPNARDRRSVNYRSDNLYLRGYLNKYLTEVYLFDASGKALYNTDTSSFNTLQARLQTYEPVNEVLYFKEDAANGHYYLAHIPIPDDSNSGLLGRMFIDFTLRKAGSESVYPELLQSAGDIGIRNERDYEYALYLQGRLVVQTSNYAFPTLLPAASLPDEEFSFRRKGDDSELWYQSGPGSVIVVVQKEHLTQSAVALFSYLFGGLLLISGLVLVYRLLLRLLSQTGRPVGLTNLPLRRRIHMSMLGLVAVAFLVIGIVTVRFFRERYTAGSQERLQAGLQQTARALEQYLNTHHGLSSPEAFEAEVQTPEFRQRIANLADQEHADINIYLLNGRLGASSQEDIYDKSLLAPVMHPLSYQQLQRSGSSLVQQEEKIGRLSFPSYYMPLRSEVGITLGYINLPSFFSTQQLRLQISGILVTLINLYAFIFLISSLLAVAITNSLTRPFELLRNHFRKIGLQQNELLEWPYNDEIGELVREYNKMIRKVEDSAQQLAESEREGAWREMARQVAHEIKNPLTPMKLHIQYLQQALRSGRSDVRELTERVANSMIEQIDNLNYIASEFSSFAKMPESRPEAVELDAFLENTVALYKNETGARVRYIPPEQPLTVYLDRSQLLRICNNLLQNALQSIPEGRDGLVQLHLSQVNGKALIAVQDNGSGIAPEARERIFKPYFTTKSSGTGLGLAMTRKIVELWEGRIWFETQPGEGTTFYVSLPLQAD
jgi:two-component system nitrogen regulation sensor histidine kinase NtrY